MKDKKINKLLSDVEKGLGSLSEQITNELFETKPAPKREDLDFGKYHKPKKIEMFSAEEPEQEPDLVEALASNISARLINEIARDVFGEEVETIEDVAPDVQDKFVEVVTEQVRETPELVETEDFKLSEERIAELQEAKMRSYASASQKLGSKVVKENELLPTKQEIFEVLGDPKDPVTQAQLSQSMSTILIRIQQQLSSLGGGGTGLQEIKTLLDSLDGKFTGIIDSLENSLIQEIDSVDSALDSFQINLTTDDVPEGPSGTRLYYKDSYVETLVDSDYINEKVALPPSLTFRGGTAVDVDSVADPDNGDVYVNDSEAVANSTWIGIVGETIREAQALAWADSDAPGTGGKWYKVGSVSQDNDQLILDAENKAVPPGTMSMWMGPSSPSGYFFCRGGTFDIARYPLLHAALTAGYSGYVAGNLPDFRGRFPGGDGGSGLTPLDGKTGRLWNQMTADPSTSGLSVTASQNMTASSSATTTINSTGSTHTHDASSSSSTSISGGGSSTTGKGGAHSHSLLQKEGTGADNISGQPLVRPYDTKAGKTSLRTYSESEPNIGKHDGHTHTIDLSGLSATTSTTTSVQSTKSGHTHGATTTVNTSLGNKGITVDVDGWDDYTRPYSFNVNFIIKHDAE